MRELYQHQKDAVSGCYRLIREGKHPLVYLATGCLSGDTIININRCKNGEKWKIEKLFQSFNFGFNPNIKTFCRSFNGEKILLNEIEEVVFSGKKQLFEIKTEGGKIIKATKDHKIMTKDGFKSVSLLSLNDLLMVDSLNAKKSNGTNKKWDTLVYGVPFHKYARSITRKGKLVKRIEKHRAIYESKINGITLYEYKFILRNDKDKSKNLIFINPKEYHIHHKNGDHYDNTIDNLECLSVSEHLKSHSKIYYQNFNQGIPSFEKVISIEKIGIEDTYDICCKAPNHNFVANGIVVHNSGKGSVFSKISLDATSKNKRVLIIVNKLMLINNAIKELKHFDLECTEYSGSEKKISSLMCGTIQSLYKMKERDFDVIIIDEAHNYDANGNSSFKKFMETFPNVIWVALTATPFRGKKYIFGEDRFWDLAYKKDINDLTKDKFLVPLVYQNQNQESVIDCTNVRKSGEDYCLDDLEKEILNHKDKIEAQLIDCLKKSQDRKKIIFITTGIDHAELIYSLLGEEAVIIHSRFTPLQNESRMKSFQFGNYKYLVSVLIASEGFDCPIADCIVMMRPTRSPRLYIQAAGRVLRLFEGKKDALFLDYGQIVDELGSIYNLKIKEDLKGEEPKKELKIECPICDKIYFHPRKECECGKHTFYRSCLYCGEKIPMTEVCLCGGGLEARTKNLTLESYSKESAIKVQKPTFEFCIHQGPKQEVYLCKIREGLFGTSYFWYIPHFKMSVIAQDLEIGEYEFFELKELKQIFENLIKFVVLKKDGKYFKPVALGLENSTYFLK